MKNRQFIKRCPMCGSKASLIPDRTRWFIQCRKCGVRTKSYTNESSATYTWNNRVNEHKYKCSECMGADSDDCEWCEEFYELKKRKRGK